MIPYGRQLIDKSDIDAVVGVLESDYLTQGKTTEKFESALAKRVNANYCTVVNSATSALHLACLALGVNQSSLVWTSPISFVASSNCALYCGASVDFVDIDFTTNNLSADHLKKKLMSSKARPDVLIVVHMAGQSCDMKAIHELSIEYGFRVIEDASHAIGGTYESNPIGCCNYSDLAIFSFHPVKIITSGEGGAIATNCQKINRKVAQLRSHGITRDKSQMASDDPWYYEQQDLGLNYRMTDIHASLGLSQLTKLDEFIEKRIAISNLYKEYLSDLDLCLPATNDSSISAWHLYIVKLTEDDAEKRRNVFEVMREKGIGVNVHYIPIYKQPYYSSLGFANDYCPEAERYYKSCLTLPIHPGLKDEDVKYIADTLAGAL